MNIFNKKPFLIAEIGTNFHGVAKKENISEIEASKKMIKEAKNCGFDAVLFYSFKAENVFCQNSSEDIDWISNSFDFQLDFFKKFDSFGIDEFKELNEFCHEVGILFLVSPLDFDSVDYLDEFLSMYVISSFDLSNLPFIEYIAEKNKPILLSTGGATMREIKEAINVIEDISISDVAILHGVLSYPTEYSDANLLMIKDLINQFPNYEIGYFDYTESNNLVLLTAYNYGAKILIKPFTIDKYINNHFYSMDSHDVIEFKKAINFLSKINGYSNKQPLICESSAIKAYRKSIVAKSDIKKGEVISKSNITFKSPALGIPPRDVNLIIGKKAIFDIKKDSILEFEMFE